MKENAVRNSMARVAAVLATSMIIPFAGSAAAQAAPDDHNGVAEVGELMMFYNTKGMGSGSFHDFVYDTTNFGTLRFLSSGSGKGLYVKNNAASAWNHKPGYFAHIYFNSNFRGACDYIPPETHWNLSDTKNNDASYKWAGGSC